MDTNSILNQLIKAGVQSAVGGNNNQQNSGLAGALGSLLGGGAQQGNSGLAGALGGLLGGAQNQQGGGLAGALGGLLGGGQQQQNSGLAGALGGLLGGGQQSSGMAGALGSLLGGNVGKGALAAGAIGALLGAKPSSGGLGGAASMGGLATLGMMAYNAYNKYQEQNAQVAAQTQYQSPQQLESLSNAQVEARSQGILLAVLAAAKADGVIDDREKQLIAGELSKMTQDSNTQSWVQQQLQADLNPQVVASVATSPEMATEMYMMTAIVMGEPNQQEAAYLQQLGSALKLDAGLQASILQQVRGQA